MENQKIIFMGTPNFAKTVLEELINLKYEILLVVTQPDKQVGRKKILTPSPVKEVAMTNNIPYFQPLKIRKDFQKIIDLKPDLIITAAYGQIIPKEVLNCPKFGCINLHASLLPFYRGGAPIQRAILNGDKKTGISLMYMDEKMDEGDILYQEEIAIDIKDTNKTLFEKLALLSCKIIRSKLPLLFQNKLSSRKQDHNFATYAYNLKKEEEFISFNRDYMVVYNHIRALLENPGCYGILKDKKYKFHEVFFMEDKNSEAGIFYGIEENYLKIGCINGYILVFKIQPEGKNILDAKTFMNGYGNKLKGEYFNEKI